MERLLIFRSDQSPFSKEEVVSALESIVGVSDVRADGLVAATVEGTFSYGGETTIVRLGSDPRSVSVSGLGDPSLVLALELQRRMAGPLHAIDLGYSFEVDLSKIPDLQSFRLAIQDL